MIYSKEALQKTFVVWMPPNQGKNKANGFLARHIYKIPQALPPHSSRKITELAISRASWLPPGVPLNVHDDFIKKHVRRYIRDKKENHARQTENSSKRIELCDNMTRIIAGSRRFYDVTIRLIAVDPVILQHVPQNLQTEEMILTALRQKFESIEYAAFEKVKPKTMVDMIRENNCRLIPYVVDHHHIRNRGVLYVKVVSDDRQMCASVNQMTKFTRFSDADAQYSEEWLIELCMFDKAFINYIPRSKMSILPCDLTTW